MWAQPQAEAAAEIRVQHPHVVLLQAEHGGDVVVAVRDALDLVVDRVLAVALVDDGGGVRLHRVVMLDCEPVILPQLDRRPLVGSLGIAPRLRRRLDPAALHRRHVAELAHLCRVGNGRLRLIGHRDQGRGVASRLEILRHDESHRLAAVVDLAVVERAEGRAGRRHRVLIVLVAPGGALAVLVRDHLDHAGHSLGRRGVDRRDLPAGDGARHDVAVREVRGGELTRVLGQPGDLGRAVDTGAGAADVGVAARGAERLGHADGPYWMRLSESDCGVPAAACSRPRTMARRASSTLKPFSDWGSASATTRSAAA